MTVVEDKRLNNERKMELMPNDPRAIRGNFNRPRTNKMVNVVTAQVATWGEPCDEYEAGCPVCEAWKLFDKNFSAPSVDEVLAVIKSSHMMSCPTYKSGNEDDCLCKPS
jgi:hypothetical protein